MEETLGLASGYTAGVRSKKKEMILLVRTVLRVQRKEKEWQTLLISLTPLLLILKNVCVNLFIS